MGEKSAESFVARWARLKRQSGAAPSGSSGAERREPSEAAAEAVDVPSGGVRPAEQASPHSDPPAPPECGRAPNAATFEDVDFAALDHTSDYTRFMQPGVPDAVRQQALRRLWATDPLLALPDELNDYMGDYTDAAVAVPSRLLNTAYKIGRGFLDEKEVAAWEELGRPATPAPAVASATAPLAPESQPGSAVPVRADGPQSAPGISSHAERPEETEVPSRLPEEAPSRGPQSAAPEGPPRESQD